MVVVNAFLGELTVGQRIQHIRPQPGDVMWITVANREELESVRETVLKALDFLELRNKVACILSDDARGVRLLDGAAMEKLGWIRKNP